MVVVAVVRRSRIQHEHWRLRGTGKRYRNNSPMPVMMTNKMRRMLMLILMCARAGILDGNRGYDSNESNELVVC